MSIPIAANKAGWGLLLALKPTSTTVCVSHVLKEGGCIELPTRHAASSWYPLNHAWPFPGRLLVGLNENHATDPANEKMKNMLRPACPV